MPYMSDESERAINRAAQRREREEYLLNEDPDWLYRGFKSEEAFEAACDRADLARKRAKGE